MIVAGSMHAAATPATNGDRPCGYVDGTGAYVIPRRFDAATDFAPSGLAAVLDNGRWGFIDSRGQYAIRPTFDGAKSFREGLAAVCLEKQGWGFIEPAGRWIIPPKYAFADSFSDGWAVIKDDAAEVGGCSEGQEDLRTPAGSECEASNTVDPDGPGRYTLIDRSERRISDKSYHCIARMSEGAAAFQWKDEWGYLDRSGREMIRPRFKRAKPFGEGLAAVLAVGRAPAAAGGLRDQGRWGIIDHRGVFVIRPKFEADEMGTFSEGLISIEGLSIETVLRTSVGREAAGRLRQGDRQRRRSAEEENVETQEWGGYLDRKGFLRIAAPFCGFDDANPGQRSFREISTGLAKVIMQEPASITPFACAPGLMSDVVMFIDRRGSYRRPTSSSPPPSPAPLIPWCPGADGRSGRTR